MVLVVNGRLYISDIPKLFLSWPSWKASYNPNPRPLEFLWRSSWILC